MPLGPGGGRLLAVVRPRAAPGRLGLQGRGRAHGALRHPLDADEAGRTLTADDPFEAHRSFSLNSGGTERVCGGQAFFAASPG
jgi:hypothetical protein